VTDYRNDTSQKVRAEVLKNDRAVQKNTFLSHTHSEEGGRFAKPQTVIGETPTVQYPMSAPNWSVDPVGPEPSLGFSVDQHEAVGEYREVQASLEELGDPTTPEASTAVDIAQSQPVALPLAGAKANASVDDPSRTGDAEAPRAVPASYRAEGEPPAISNPHPELRRR
jgi:hypothetical protein